MKVAVGLRRVAAGKRTSGRRAAQIAAAFKILQKLYKNSNSISIGDFHKSYPQCSHVLYLKN